MKHWSLILFFSISSFLHISAKKSLSSFAIVVDKVTYNEAKTEIDNYAKAIEKEGLQAILVVDKWQQPDSIRNLLIKFYHSSVPLEGAVFIGDIPVPMIRDAQHFTTAFKMDQERYAWNRSSIASDRFYEDFDLEFNYLKRDSVFPLYFYYSLKAESPQRLDPEIYSGRIKAPAGNAKYELLKNYLRKVVDYKANKIAVDQVLFFTGHGYNSQCERTWMDEKIALTQQFDYLQGQRNYLEYINFQYEDHIKFRLMDELKRPNLDIALLHHHGAPEYQLLDGMPETSSVQGQISDVKYYLRSKLRSAGKDADKITKVKADYINSLGVPEEWFEGTFSKEQIDKDSAFSANLDISIDDHKNFASQVPFIMLDACFTGSFHLDNYISGEYIFDEGKTMVVQANTVNALQDKWPDEMVGLMGLGMRAGFWNKMNCSLETHLIGDPTFSFKSVDEKLYLNKWINSENKNTSFWKKELNAPHADLQALALRMLYEINGNELSDLYFETFKTSPFYAVRMEALKLLRFCKDDNFIKAINLGINDSYEFIQRVSAIYMSETGNPVHVPFIIEALLRNNLSKRVNYNLGDAIGLFEKQLLLSELDKQIEESTRFANNDETINEIKKKIEYSCNRMKTYADEVFDIKTTEKEKFFNLKSFRNQTVHPYLEGLIGFLETTDNARLKLTGIEMLGWFDHSYKRDIIIDFCEKELKKQGIKSEIRNELIKTKNRIK